MSYSDPVRVTYTQKGVDFTGSAATDLKVAGPSGMVGRVVSVSVGITTAVTVAASTVLVGTVADTDAYASLAVPVKAINTTANNPTIYTDDDNLIPADSLVVIGNGGGSTAGVGDVSVVIDWF